MAYDQNAAYEPPRRHYYEPAQQSNPARNDYQDYNGYAEHGNAQYEHYDQGYNQGYPQQNGGYHDYSYDQGMTAGYDHNYGNGYQGGHRGPQQDDRQYYQENNSRAYDPRYQPRAQRGPPPPQHPGPQPGQRSQPPPGRPPYHGDPHGQPPPKQNGHPPQSQRPREPYPQQNGDYAPAPRMNGNAYPPLQTQPPPQDSSRMSMEEWKAKEKARFKKAALSPETLPLDNAFPTFPKKKEKSSDMSGAAGTSSQRGSVEQGRPSTSRSERPGASRENSYNTGRDAQQPPRRPDMMDRQYSSPELANSRHGQQHPNAYGRPDQRDAYSAATTPVREQYPEQWPMVHGQTPPKAEPQRRSPPQANGYGQYPGPNQRGPPQQQSYDTNGAYEQRQMPKQRGPAPIDTRQHQQRPVHSGQPMSPAYVPPRPSTSQGPRPPPNQGLSSPIGQYAGSTIPQEGTRSLPNQMAAQAPTQDQDSYSRNGSLGDIYDDYNTTPPRQIQRAPTSREEEIEAEMPDFDAAAPQQTSNLHKRNQTVDKHLAEPGASRAQPPPLPRMATAPPEVMQQSGSAPDLRYAQQQHGPRGAPQRGMAGPYEQDQPPSAQRQYDIPYRNQPPPQERSYPQGRPLPPPNAPFATEPQVRRSLDDGRGPPNRQGPPQQGRFYQNGAPPRGYPPQQRPDLDRNPTSQTIWSDPGSERVGSAPPPHQGLPQPPATATGVPLSQQRSAPDQSSRHSNPDSLPHHPVPVRAGHVQQGQTQPSKPPPVRTYNSGPQSSQSGAPHQRQPSVDQFASPVTQSEIERLRQTVDAPPHSPKQTLILVKKLVEASTVLANENGRADPKTAAKNRERYINEAYKRLKKLVAAGYPDSQFYMADCYGQGTLGLEVDTKEAFKLYQAAAKAGHAQAAYRTAVCCEMGPEEGGGTSRDYPKAVQWYRRAAALGDGPAMYKLGVVLLKGLLGNPRNIAEAVTWLKRGAEKADKDNPHALHELAMMHESSNTNPEIRNKVVADDGYARELYTQAAQLGYKFSQFRLGQAYEYGALGLPIDNRNSIAWYTKAAAQGEHQAELALSGWYLTGAPGILEHSDTEAYLWARKAASSEPPLAKAMFAMGYFTENGIGCPASMEEARKWYGRAASYKFPKAIERLEELRRNPTGKNSKSAPANGKLTRKDQKKDEENCVVM